jgi:hypothetical protein
VLEVLEVNETYYIEDPSKLIEGSFLLTIFVYERLNSRRKLAIEITAAPINT